MIPYVLAITVSCLSTAVIQVCRAGAGGGGGGGGGGGDYKEWILQLFAMLTIPALQSIYIGFIRMQQQMFCLYKTRLLKIFPSSITWKYYKVGLSHSQRVLKLGTQVDFHLANIWATA